MRLTTPHQDFVLTTLRDGGSLRTYWYDFHTHTDVMYYFEDSEGNVSSIKEKTVHKLLELKFVKHRMFNLFPDVREYYLTELGLDWLKENHL